MNALTATTVATAAACGVMAGVFHTFSTFVMKGLDDVPGHQAVQAMQGFNRHAPRAVALPLFGAAAGSAVLGLPALGRLGDADARWQAAGALLYLTAFGLTVAYHVPRNNALDGVPLDAGGPGDGTRLATAWAAYAPGWRRWNHVRTATSTGAAIAFVLSLT